MYDDHAAIGMKHWPLDLFAGSHLGWEIDGGVRKTTLGVNLELVRETIRSFLHHFSMGRNLVTKERWVHGTPNSV